MLSSVVAEFPGCPRLLQWMCTGCGSFSWLAAPARASRIFRGVTALDPSVSSRPLTLRRSPPPFHTATPPGFTILIARSEEHTSELQSHHDLVCRLLLEKKKQR